MSADTFVDTNILIYAHDLDAGDRQRRAAARQGGAAILLNEDLNHDQVIAGVRVQNPFLSP
jgi:predicted nucleic acid-binding protein